MKLSEEEITRHLLQSSETLGEVKGLVSQILEHYKSFNGDRKEESKALWSEIKGLSNKIDEGQKENRAEIIRFVSGMNKKIEDNTGLCSARDEKQDTRISTLEKKDWKQVGFIGGVSACVSFLIALFWR